MQKPRKGMTAARRVRYGWRAVAACGAAALLVPALAAMRPAPPGGPAGPLLAPLPRTKPVPVHVVRSRPPRLPKVPVWHRPPVIWPAAGTQTVALRPAAQAAARPAALPGGRHRAAGAAALAAPTPGSVRAGSLPVWLGPAVPPARAALAAEPPRARVVMAPRRAAAALGASGVVFSVAGSAAGAVHVSLDYRGFAYADAGGYAARLALVALPGCALTSPRTAACRRMTPLGSANDLVHDRLGANVTLPAGGSPAVLAVTTSPSGSAGDYSATPLSEAGTWAEGGASGAFTYSYPIAVPPVPGGLAPVITLGYNSQRVDGLTSSANDQASWIGDGWDYQPGYIERDYQSCARNPAGNTQTGDLCWSSNNGTTLSLGGTTTTLVNDPSNGWHAEADNGDQISYVTGSGSNGTHDDDYWVVTDPDGTSYYFGLNQLPGYSSGDATTNSAWTVPVYATSSTQPCYDTTFPKSHCRQAWRWNLDYVTDSHGDAEAFFYNTETNYYASDSTSSNPNTTADASYIQGGALSEIQYGLRAGHVYDATPAGEVDFTAPEDRTDVPTNSTYGGDLACSSGANCDVISPTFWSKFDLTTIQAKSLEGSSLQAVDSWSLAKTYPDPHDSTSTPTLWLSSITRTGKDGTTTNLQLPPVKFTPEAMPNRVETQQDLNDGYSIITRMRMYKVTNETGGVITVTYDTPPSSCTSGNFPAEDSNSTLCFPDFWTPPNKSSPIEDWFNKYVVSTVTQADVVVGGSPVVTNYSYKGAAWHYNDDALSRSKNRTWDQWRGFRTVTTETGAAPDPVTQTVDTYFQGMDGDYQSGGGTSSASLTSSLGGQKVTDSDQFAGMDFEHIVYDGAGGGVVTDTVTVPWTSAATADQNQPSPLPDLKAFLTGTALTQTFTALAAGGYREADDTFTHDSAGRVTVEAKVPDTADASEDTCTQTSYATPSSGNPDSNLTDLAAEVIVTSVAPSACPVSGTPAKAELVSDTRSYYDGATTLGVLPGAGDVTMTKLATSYNGTAEVFTMRSQATYDQYGRVTSATDADNNTTTTSYTPATGAEPTSVTVTDPMSLATTTTYDPGRDLPLTVTSPAGYISTEQYDSLGRLTSAWKPRNPAGGLANETFSYTVSNNSPSIVTTNTLNVTGSYVSSDALYDSLGRQIETQSQTSDGSGMDVSDTYYNSDGWRATVSNPYYVQFNPGNNVVFGNLVQAVGGAVPSQTRYTYDGDGRVTAQAALTNGKETWETDTSYGGNYTTVNPPAGGTAETTYTDGNGQTSYIYSYHAANPPASPPAPGTGPKTGASGWDETGYSYTPAQQLSGITDTAGNQWSYAYNLAGYRTSATDPDSGTTTSKYDPNGNPLQVTDARNDTISYTYDADNRKTAEYDITGGAGQTGSDQLAAWTYDTLAPGLLTSATAYGPGGTSGTSYTDAVRGYGKWGLPTGNNVSISAGPFAGTYTQLFGYNANTQQENSYTDYAVPGLPTETVTVGLDNLNRPAGVTGTGATALLQYNELSQPAEYSMGASTLPVTVSDTYDPETGLLKTSQTQTGLSNPQTIAATTYNYDNAGLVTSESDNPANGPVQVQCFNYDYLGRLTTAWSQGSTGCSGGPSQAAEAGAAAPYWDAYQYNAVNDLTSVTSTPPTGGATTTTSSFPAAGSAQPHAVSAQQVAGPGHNLSTSYGYNAAGDTTSVSNSAGGQTLSWNDAGKLASVTTTGLGAGTTSYVYDANGNLLLRKGPSGTTLFLPDEEITQSGSTTVGTRYYSIGGVTVASMSNGTVNYLSGDTQGTATIAVDGSSLTPAYRYYDPFGNPVGPAPSAWLGVRGFVGGDTDTATGLTNLGAREYAPATQSFLSPDALINPDNPQDLNAYAYASDSPAAFSDPSGMYLVGYGSGCDTNCGGSSGGSNGNSGGGNGGWGSGGRTNPWPYGPPGDVHTTMFEDPPVHVVRTPRAVTPMGSAIGGGVCTGILFRLGACYSERYAAGSTPGQVKQSLIGAVGVLSIVVPLGDIADAIGGVLGGIFRGGSIAADEATVVNAAGRAYPSVTDLRTGEPIPAPPSGLTRVPVSDRVPWGPQERGAFIKQWYDQGYQTPEGGWGQYDIHHIIPREYGGTNDFENLTPVLRTVHQTGFNPWWMGYGG